MEQAQTKKATATETRTVETTGVVATTSNDLQHVAKPEKEDSIADRINAAYAESRSNAINAVMKAIEAGNLLLEQREKIKDGWVSWLGSNCPEISQRTAYHLIKSALYVQEHNGYIDAQSVRQLYISAGAIYEDEDDERENGKRLADTLITPLMNLKKRVSLFFTDRKIEKMNPVAAPRVIGWVDDTVKELTTLRVKLVTKFGDKPAIEEGARE